MFHVKQFSKKGVGDMQTITINVIKKNRKYFACQVKGFKAKLIIDDNSKDIEIGEHDLLVNDKSVRTKWGTDLIYELAADREELEDAGICVLKHFTFNWILVDYCRDLGGRWDSDVKVWVFSDIVADKIEELDYRWNSDLVSVEIKALNEISIRQSEVTFCGYQIAKAFGRDSGAKLGEGISMLQGDIDSGGSMKNWVTRVYENSIFRLKVPSLILDEMESGESILWEIKRL